MKTKSALAASIILVASTLTACDAMLGTSVDVGPDYYGSAIANDWYPSLPGAPLVSPVYWGNQIYPGGAILPPIPPVKPNYRPQPVYNGPVGNSRPGQAATPSAPAQSSTPVALPSHPLNVSGGQPGIVMPPEGSGYQSIPTTGRH